jgi:hypothetical protein
MIKMTQITIFKYTIKIKRMDQFYKTLKIIQKKNKKEANQKIVQMIEIIKSTK